MAPEVRPRGSAEPAYSVAVVDPLASAARIVEIWRASGADFSVDFAAGAARYDWFYARNPAGAGTQFLLRQGSDGPWLGALGVGRREFWCGPQRVTAGVLVDFVIDPAHRVFYPALLLQRTARQHELGPCTVILAHPNRNSAGVILRAGPYGDLVQTRYARVVGFARQFARHLPRAAAGAFGALAALGDRVASALQRVAGPRLSAAWSAGFDARFDALWQRVREDPALWMGTRDRAFLAWRFASRPGRAYRVLEVRCDGSQALEGYFACHEEDDTLVVSDLLVAGDARMIRAALRALVSAARPLGVRSVSLSVVASRALRAALPGAGFRARETGPVFVAVTEAVAAEAGAAEWYVTFADADI